MKNTLLLGFIGALWAFPAMAGSCVTYESPVTLRGKMETRAADGVSYPVLRLETPICVDLAPGEDLGAPASGVQEIQMTAERGASLPEALMNQNVLVVGRLHPRGGEQDHTQVILEAGSLKKR